MSLLTNGGIFYENVDFAIELKEYAPSIMTERKTEDVAGPGDLSAILGDIDTVNIEFSPLRELIALKIQSILQTYEGLRAKSLEEGQNVSRRINDFVASYGLRLRYPESSLPATIAFSQVGNARPGIFLLRTTIDGKQANKGSSRLPLLEVVKMPPRHRRIESVD